MKHHPTSHPGILYFGTPVVLISTVNEDTSYNLAPISSVFWLGYRCMIGIGSRSKTTENLLRTKECVLNLPSVNEAEQVDRLALTTGSNPVPEHKRQKGYWYEPDKFKRAGLTPVSSESVGAPGVAECPVQLEARLKAVHRIGEDDEAAKGKILSLELDIVRVGLNPAILMEGHPDRVDPDKWRPLIMSFQQLYGLGGQVRPSALATIPERLYRPDAVHLHACPFPSHPSIPEATATVTT
jgi:flavin reductase (DIM6/NTAB) family NADH-FMN oxidoreductase RutF